MREAAELLQIDPTIHDKIFEVEMYNWYGSAALSVYLKAHSKIEKKRYLGSADKLNMHFRTKHDEDRLLDR